MNPTDLYEWISSKEVLAQSNISRATLNNYIKLGILPRPIVKNPGATLKGVKQIGYFPLEVLDRISKVRQFKRENQTIDEIAAHFQKMDPLKVKDGDTIEKRTEPCPVQTCETIRDDSHLTLTIDELDAPAYLINHRFEIEWINDAAQKKIFNQPVRTIEEQASRNIFKLFFRWQFHDHVQNWQQIIGAHLGIVKQSLPRSDMPTLFSGIGENEIHLLKTLYDDASAVECKEICDLWARFELRDKTIQVYHIYCMHFREGLFFVYVPAEESSSDILNLLGQRRSIIADLLRKRIPSLASLSVLVADLQDSVRICAELLPSEYFELINQLWESLAGCIEKHEGIYGKHAGDGFVYYFINRPNGGNHVMNSINCAKEMRERIKVFSEKWRVRKGWLNDFYLNIGINEGQEFCGTIRCASNVEFTALGDTINYASRLSDFARYGSIWVTKNVINKLGPEELASIRFGIQKQNGERTVFAENSFARVADMLAEHDRPSFKFADIATIPVTEVF
ncbi:MAG: adenylate/guanylate cyclase domain-containing protein [Desulfobacterales bacterium]|nr:adenylate/guanylate cyclase domain-containing protein [Desulfobacterales bacterium]MDD3951271.1 adenylate/guanylate cyclase domain-containing protein [Desulfobacterales bacterium]MDY0377971.1 adenylate/guanylate cyclase domain-containing protein [Desulfobacterales bacterium]